MADLILMVGVGAMTAYFMRAGIDFSRRSLTKMFEPMKAWQSGA
jgi:hypothetical protein